MKKKYVNAKFDIVNLEVCDMLDVSGYVEPVAGDRFAFVGGVAND